MVLALIILLFVRLYQMTKKEQSPARKLLLIIFRNKHLVLKLHSCFFNA